MENAAPRSRRPPLLANRRGPLLSACREISAGSRVRNAANFTSERISPAIKDQVILPMVRCPEASELHHASCDGSINRATESAGSIVHAPRNLSVSDLDKVHLASHLSAALNPMPRASDIRALRVALVLDRSV